MNAEVFLDTNVLVYAATGGAGGRGADGFKKSCAMELIQTRNFGTSAQVLQELDEATE